MTSNLASSPLGTRCLLLTLLAIDLIVEKFKAASAFHRRLAVEHDAIVPSVLFGGSN